MKTRSLFLFFFLFLFVSSSFAQFTPEWTATFARPDSSYIEAVITKIDNSGNVYTASNAVFQNHGLDYILIKYNSAGIQQWRKNYNNDLNTDDQLFDMELDNSGNIILTGQSNDKILTLKYDPAGELQWSALYSTPSSTSNIGYTITCDNSGNIFIGGSSRMTSSFGVDMVTLKYNSAGVQQWVKIYDSPFHSKDETIKIKTDNLGNLYVAGASLNADTLYDYILIKYSNDGTEQWIQRYDTPEHYDETLMSMTVDNSGNVYLSGYTNPYNKAVRSLIVKFNSSGDLQWATRITNTAGTLGNASFAIVVDNSENVYVTGSSYVNDNSLQYLTCKINPQGVIQWSQSYYGEFGGVNRAWAITLDAASNVYVTGYSAGLNTQRDIATIKYSSNGVQQWLARYSGANQSITEAFSIVKDNSGFIYVSGFSKYPDIYNNLITIKYSQTSGVVNTSSNVPSQYSLGQNYPNPFNPNTKINFSLPKSSFVSLKVFDLSGKEVSGLIDEILSAGTYQADFNGANLTSGIYFYTLKTENFSETKKMLLVK